MRNKYIVPSVLLLLIGGIITITACKKDIGPPAPPPNYSYVEEFDTMQNAVDKGWTLINNSRPIGSGGWMQGEYAIDFLKGQIVGFSPQSSNYSGQDFVSCTYNAGDGDATLSAWLISPPTFMKTGDQIVFYTRTLKNPADFADRMQLRLNAVDSSTNVGGGPLANDAVANMVGNFNQVLLDINPNLVKSGNGSYPGNWTQYTVTVNNIPQQALRRFAFRYFVVNGGTNGSNSQAVGVDSVAFISR